MARQGSVTRRSRGTARSTSATELAAIRQAKKRDSRGPRRRRPVVRRRTWEKGAELLRTMYSVFRTSNRIPTSDGDRARPADQAAILPREQCLSYAERQERAKFRVAAGDARH